MFSIKNTVLAARAVPAQLPKLAGDAFVFGSAPNAHVPAELLSNSTIVTANGSQVGIEEYGIDKPDFTFMRSNMDSGRQVDIETLEALREKSTKHLIVMEGKRRSATPEHERHLKSLEKIGYDYDEFSVVSAGQLILLIDQITTGTRHRLAAKPLGSAGVRAIAASLYMGASRVIVAGISFVESGHQYSQSGLKRKHVDSDQLILQAMRSRGLDIISTDQSLVDATGIRHWCDDTPNSVVSG